MISGYSYRLRSGLILVVAALPVLGSGCNSGLDSPHYPTDLRYTPRQDLLIKGEGAQEVRVLPAPGKLEEGIRKATESETVKKFDPRDLEKDDRNEIRKALNEIFGTPAHPSIEPAGPKGLKPNASQSAVDAAASATEDRDLHAKYLAAALQDYELKPADLEDLKVDRDDLKDGSSHYRRHCMQCHGLNGDGRGPTAPWVHPHPRDYRQGKYKFISTSTTARSRKPRRADLYRTVSKGIEGTSMPGFGLQSEKDIDSMVSYVIHLSIRGQVEYDTIQDLLGSKDKQTGKIDKEVLEGQSIRTHVYNRAAVVLAGWVDSNKREAIKPPAYPYEGADEKVIDAAVRNGYQIFISKKGNCVSCHTDFGRQAPYKYDAWGTLVQPRNLTAGNYRGGRRPIDLYWRISGGIDPSGMSATTTLDPKEYWDLIHFVQAMPYPKMLPEDIRKKVYGASDKGSDSRASR